MNVGIIGFESSGKSTLYRTAAVGLSKGDVAAIPVPDPRFDKIVRQVKPKKITPATVILHDDIPSAKREGKALPQRFLDQARNADLLLHVVRAFDENADFAKEQEALDLELLLADLQIIENRLERLNKTPAAKAPGSSEYLEKAALELLKAALEEGKPIRSLSLNEEAAAVVRNYQFLTAKGEVVAFNIGESSVGKVDEASQDAIDRLEKHSTPAFALCASLEEEVSLLDPADQPEFLSSLGLDEPASARLIRAIYRSLGLITFFTAGENETRAWSLKAGSSALKAAETIHTEIAKGFIRAEIVHYEDYEAAGSLEAAYSAGKMHLEGKEYVIRDGDMIHIRNKS